ncbi:MAG: hypothetical protein ABIR79_16200 [Candidatus Binatia bacterium]
MSDEADAPRTLHDVGVGDDETTPGTLLALTGRSPDLDRAIVERLAMLGDEAHAVALRDLAAAAEQRGWKAVVKDAKRALYKFGQRGVVPPAEPAAPTPPPRWMASPLEGWLSGIDGRGDRLVWIAKAQPNGGLLVMTAIVNEPNGLRDVNLADLPRKSLRRMHDDLRARHHVQMTDVDGAYCDALLAEGFDRARAAGTAEPVGQYPALRARLTSQPPAALEPPLIARVVPDAMSDASASAAGATLLDEIEFFTWALDRETLAPYLDEIQSARDSPLVLSRPQQEERVSAALARAERELFGGTPAAIYRRRLEEMAYVLHASGRRDLARAAAATAVGLANGTTPLPFFTELLRRSVGAFVVEDEAKARAESEGSVLVRPGSAAGPPPVRR